MARNALAHAAVGIDGRRDAVVGVAQQPAAILDGPHARHIQVLPRRARVAVPSIVADVHQHFGAEPRKLPHFVGKHRLVADEDAIAMAVEAEDLALVAARELGNAAGEFVREESKSLKGMYSPNGTR